MDDRRRKARQRLKDIPTFKEYEEETRKVKLTDEEFYILDMTTV